MFNKIVLTILFIVTCVYSQTNQWRLIWDKNTEEDMDYYEIYRDSISTPSQMIDTVKHKAISASNTTMIFTDVNLLEIGKGKRIYYRVRAVDQDGLKSDYSEIVSAAIPKLSLPTAIYLSANSQYNILVDAIVADPTTSASQLEWDIDLPTGFSWQTTQVSNETVLQINTGQSWSEGYNSTFTVSNLDTFVDVATIPVFSPQSLVSMDDSVSFSVDNSLVTANIHWSTAIPTKGKVVYNESGSQTEFETTMESIFSSSNHQVSIASLDGNSSYDFKIVSLDELGIETTTATFNFTTPDPGSVTTATASDIEANLVGSGTSVQITWNTSALSKDYVEYGISTSYGTQTTKDSEFLTSHDAFIDDLLENTEYNFRVVTESEDAIVTYSDNQTFTTLSASADVFNYYPVPLELSNPAHNKQVTFEGFPLGSDLYIYNLLGDLVFKKTDIQTVPYYWNAKNNSGKRVHTGVYLFTLKSTKGKEIAKGKLVVIY